MINGRENREQTAAARTYADAVGRVYTALDNARDTRKGKGRI